MTDRDVLLAGDDRARQAPAVAPDMEDSIMRGPAAYNEGGSSSSAAANASAVAAEELFKKFRYTLHKIIYVFVWVFWGGGKGGGEGQSCHECRAYTVKTPRTIIQRGPTGFVLQVIVSSGV